MAEATAKKAPAKKAAAKPKTDAPVETPDEADEAGYQISQWEFVDTIPTAERVLELLNTLPDVWGIDTAEFADYVQVLPQTKKVKVPDGNGRKREVYLDCFTIYMSVAGRIRMLAAAAEENGWSVDFEPEQGCSIPGFIDLGEASGRIVYREYVVVRDEDGDVLGRKPGMAWVPKTGGKQAAGSNPYEKVETAARGRAIAAWGFGVLPGSGVASVEEVLGANANARAMQDEQQGGPQQGGHRVSRETLMGRLYPIAEAVRQSQGWEVATLQQYMGEYLTRKPGGEEPGLGIAGAFDVEKDEVDFQKVTDGHLRLLITYMEGASDRLNGRDGGLA